MEHLNFTHSSENKMAAIVFELALLRDFVDVQCTPRRLVYLKHFIVVKYWYIYVYVIYVWYNIIVCVICNKMMYGMCMFFFHSFVEPARQWRCFNQFVFTLIKSFLREILLGHLYYNRKSKVARFQRPLMSSVYTRFRIDAEIREFLTYQRIPLYEM